MLLKLVKNDLAKSKLITQITVLFVAAAALLVSLAAILTVNLTGAVDSMMKRAKTPHFIQMHTGEADVEALSQFAAQNDLVDQFQALEFLNIDNSKIQLGDHLLSGSTQDNGISVQSRKFDYLPDLNGAVVYPAEGELYAPVSYMRSYNLKKGDQAYIAGQKFTIAGFLRDSQMNSMLASSKRFLVSEKDFSKLTEAGAMEYLIEFRLCDLSALGDFENAWNAGGFPANGPIVTWPLIKMLNALSDGLIIGVVLLLAAVTMAISLLCIRFTLLTKLEEEYRETGVMKAVGIRLSGIRKIYLYKYGMIALTGCLTGFALSLLLQGKLLENIRLNFGARVSLLSSFLSGLTGILAVFLLILLFVGSVLRRIRQISASDAVRFGAASQGGCPAGRLTLSNNGRWNTNVFLGVRDVLTRRKLYATNLAVLVFGVFIMIVPYRLYSTLSSDSFITYMGVGRCDMRVDIRNVEQSLEKTAEISGLMRQDRDIASSEVYVTKAFQVRREDGSADSIRIESGNHTAFPVAYTKGSAPLSEDEIALSVLNASDMGKMVGDPVTLITPGGERQMKVCGIYSDITNGGKTAKAVFEDPSAEIMWTVIYAKLAGDTPAKDKAAVYADRFPYAKVTDITEYISQTFGPTIKSIGTVSGAAFFVALTVMAMITLLFMKMLVVKDRYSIAVMKACGLTDANIRLSYYTRVIFLLASGIIVGTVLSDTAGEALAGAVFSSLGAASFRFSGGALTVRLVYPLLMAISVIAAAYYGLNGTARITIADNIKE